MRTHQVFVSHTSDLAGFPASRSFVQAALDAVGRAGMAPVDMRYFAARDGQPAEYCQQRVRECEVYVAVVGFRYGSIAPGREVSYTELEFEAATESGIPRLVFLLAEDVRPADLADTDLGQVRIFRQKLLDGGLVVREFSSADGLELEIFHALSSLRLDGSDSAVGAPSASDLIFDVPPRDRVFTGRSDVFAAMQTRLTERAAEPTAIALHGLGGVGKTRLALEYAYRNARKYALVYWIPADETTAVVARLSRLARRLGISLNDRPEDSIISLWEYLYHSSARWLLIYDNADSPGSLLSGWPRGGPGHIIVTSRNPSWRRQAYPIEVTSFKRVESMRFIDDRLTRNTDPSDADSIAAELGDLPLALEQACAYIEETQISVKSYLELFRENDARLVFDLGTATESTRTIAKVWDVSLSNVRSKAPAGEQLLQLGAFLGPAGIARSFLYDNSQLLPEPLRSSTTQHLAFNQLLQVIGHYSLARVDEQQITFHPLVQAVVRAKLGPDEQVQWAREAVRLIDNAYPDSPSDEASAALLSHAITACAHAQFHNVAPERVVSLLAKTSRATAYFGDTGDTVRLLKMALEAVQSIEGAAGGAVADLLIRLGFASRELGALPEARDYFLRATEIRKSNLGEAAAAISEPLTGLGLVLFDIGELTEARECLMNSLAISQDSSDCDVMAVSTTRTVLGLVLWALGELHDARAMLDAALHAREDLLGKNHLAVATSIDNLAKVVLALGDSERAREMTERVLEIREAQLGHDHYHVAITLNHLGLALAATGDGHAALSAHRRALSIFRARLDPGHSHIARSLHGIGKALLMTQDAAGAVEVLTEGVAIFTGSLGLDHSETALCIADLGQAMFGSGNIVIAISKMEEAFSIITEKLPENHPECTRIRDLLAKYRRSISDI
jgi:tetratricopeptide (TPR) repeat protein